MFQHENEWLESSVKMWLSFDEKKMLEYHAAKIKIKDVYHHNIMNIITLV